MKIPVSSGNLKNGSFRIDRKAEIIPQDAWGGNNQATAAKPVRMFFEGTNEEVSTDIDGAKRIPRNARGEIKRFLKFHRVEVGEFIELIKTGDRQFAVQYSRAQAAPISQLHPPMIKQLIPLGTLTPHRAVSLVHRVVRETAVTDYVKTLYDLRCQVCGTTIFVLSGKYAEGAHIRPLGSLHNGPDQPSNILCLCPNYHVMLDGGTLSVDDDFTLIGFAGKLNVHTDHRIDIAHLRYHRSNISGATSCQTN